MWTEARRACHEAGLKEMVPTCAVEEIARWLERADSPPSESDARSEALTSITMPARMAQTRTPAPERDSQTGSFRQGWSTR